MEACQQKRRCLNSLSIFSIFTIGIVGFFMFSTFASADDSALDNSTLENNTSGNSIAGTNLSINNIGTLYNSTSGTYTFASGTVSTSSRLKASYVTELQSVVSDKYARCAAGGSFSTIYGTTAVASGKIMRGVHINELRTAIRKLLGGGTAVTGTISGGNATITQAQVTAGGITLNNPIVFHDDNGSGLPAGSIIRATHITDIQNALNSIQCPSSSCPLPIANATLCTGEENVDGTSSIVSSLSACTPATSTCQYYCNSCFVKLFNTCAAKTCNPSCIGSLAQTGACDSSTGNCTSIDCSISGQVCSGGNCCPTGEAWDVASSSCITASCQGSTPPVANSVACPTVTLTGNTQNSLSNPTACAGQATCANPCDGTTACQYTCQAGYVLGCSCTPTTCAALGLSCGSVSDGCGGTLNCGSCATYCPAGYVYQGNYCPTGYYMSGGSCPSGTMCNTSVGACS